MILLMTLNTIMTYVMAGMAAYRIDNYIKTRDVLSLILALCLICASLSLIHAQ